MSEQTIEDWRTIKPERSADRNWHFNLSQVMRSLRGVNHSRMRFECARTTTLCELVRMAGDGLYLEFGVNSGHSIRRIAAFTEKHIYGFDSFEGLPEAWNGLEVGHFTTDGNLPNVPNNVTLIKGWFDETIPVFKKTNADTVAFVHIDCDLYSSTKTIFDNLKNRFVNGSIIAFDEIFNYGAAGAGNPYLWREHEYKAFCEFLEENGWSADCIGIYGNCQAGFILYK